MRVQKSKSLLVIKDASKRESGNDLANIQLITRGVGGSLIFYFYF
jgi:hypothetical protein